MTTAPDGVPGSKCDTNKALTVNDSYNAATNEYSEEKMPFDTAVNDNDAVGKGSSTDETASSSGGTDLESGWEDLSHKSRFQAVLWAIFRLVCILGLLFLFICSLDILASAFRLLGGQTAGKVFRDSSLLANPISGLMIGVTATVVLQSSSTSTSILVSMVASGIVDVKRGIPIVMGANIGTSLTNTMVSIAHYGNREEFKRAFAGATVHDMFNWLSVLVLLPLEAISGYLYHSSGFLVSSIGRGRLDKAPPEMLKQITKPLTQLIVQLDKSVLKRIAMGDVAENETVYLIKYSCGNKTCNHIFAKVNWTDKSVGMLLLLCALVSLSVCLLSIVKLLKKSLSGRVSKTIHRFINSDIREPFSWLTGYVAILAGAILTILLQSSSVFTSALTPLVGIGVVDLERMYPLTLGANIGTTLTSVLAALASPPLTLKPALQMALCHLLFNLTGVLLFYPVPIMRKAPIGLAKLLGRTTAEYRWFVAFYVIVMFVLAPLVIFGLSIAGSNWLLGVGTPIFCLVLLVALINVIQAKAPGMLPGFIRNWNFLPECLRSLRPWDRMLVKFRDVMTDKCGPFCCSCCIPEVGRENEIVTLETANAESTKKLLCSRNSSVISFNPAKNGVKTAIKKPRSRFNDASPRYGDKLIVTNEQTQI